MRFQIQTYRREHLDGLTALYNDQTAHEPHVAPLDCDRFIRLVEGKSYFDPAGLLVAVEEGRVVGWVHACVAAGTEPWQDGQKTLPRIRMLIYPPDRLKVGAALVAEATAWCRQARADLPEEIDALHAFAGYPFYRGLWCGGEPMGLACLPHVQLALEAAGYQCRQHSVLMTARMADRPAPLQAQAQVEYQESPAPMKHDTMRQSWEGFQPRTIQATIGGEPAGSIGWVVIPYLDRLGAACVNIWALGTAEKHRRKGLAAALISRAMACGYELGARFGSVGTQLWNTPAHLSYAKFGFEPHAILIGRTLRSAEPDARRPPPAG